MPKSRVRKKKKNPLIQVIKESQFKIKTYKGKPIKVANPRYGKTKTIIHAPQQPPNNSSSKDKSKDLMDWDGG